MRRFLYISPFFPPLCRVGAFRPLKFTRHISDFDWQPVVLCDLMPNANTDTSLLNTIPDSAIILRKYSKHAINCEKNLSFNPEAPTKECISTHEKNTRKRVGLFTGREWLPMGDALFNIPYAIKIARQAIKEHDCVAIMVNADPVAALLLGRQLSKETGLPFIADLRDPWGPCDLRSPLRPFYTRWVERFFEGNIINQASKIILNTETATEIYKNKYAQINSNKFCTIRNHGDKALIYAGSAQAPEFKTFTLLFLGSFSRFVKADTLLYLLKTLKQQGINEKQCQLTLTSQLDYESEMLAKKLGILNYISCIPAVSYQCVGKLMDNADILTLILPTTQRIQAKFYDYLFSERPILAITDSHTELSQILDETRSGKLFHTQAINDMANYIIDFIRQGRHPVLKRHSDNVEKYTSHAASQKLAHILDSVVL